MSTLMQKLSSRKFWAAIAAVAITVLTALFRSDLSAETVELIGRAVIALCCYIFGESAVDAIRIIWGDITKE